MNLDDASRAFFDKVADAVPPPPDDEHHGVRSTLKTTKTLLKILQNPVKNIPKAIIKGSLDAGFKKEAGVSALQVYAYLNDHYQKAWWDWEPETFRRILPEDHGFEPTPEVMNLVGALQLITQSNGPFEQWHLFEKVGHALSGQIVDFLVVQPLDPVQCATTIKLLKTMRGPQPLELEVCGYVAACCNEAGMVFLPEDLFPVDCQNILQSQLHDKELADLVRRALSPGFEGDLGGDIEMQLAKIAEVREAVLNA